MGLYRNVDNTVLCLLSPLDTEFLKEEGPGFAYLYHSTPDTEAALKHLFVFMERNYTLALMLHSVMNQMDYVPLLLVTGKRKAMEYS